MPGRWPAAPARPAARAADDARPLAPGHRRASGLDLRPDRDEAARPPRRRRLDRLRAGRRLVLLLPDGDDATGHADPRRPDAGGRGLGLVRPPVGRLHLGRRRRLGLVRAQPRRRHGPHAVARPRGRRELSARSTGRSSRPTATVRHLDRDAFTRRGDRPLAEPDDRRRLPGRLDDPDPGRRPHDRPGADRRRRRSSTRGRRPGSSTGRARSASTRRGTGARSVAKATWS